jgi:hypothetical protein
MGLRWGIGSVQFMNGKSLGIGLELQFALWEFTDTQVYVCEHGEVIPNKLKYI